MSGKILSGLEDIRMLILRDAVHVRKAPDIPDPNDYHNIPLEEVPEEVRANENDLGWYRHDDYVYVKDGSNWGRARNLGPTLKHIQRERGYLWAHFQVLKQLSKMLLAKPSEVLPEWPQDPRTGLYQLPDGQSLELAISLVDGTVNQHCASEFTIYSGRKPVLYVGYMEFSPTIIGMPHS